MPYATAADGLALYLEEEGCGEAVLFAHEFGGDWRSWQPQVEHFRSRYRCLRYAARGFLPSAVPEAAERYGQAQATADLLAVAEAAGLGRFHLVGLSMGAYTALCAALAAPERLLSLTLAGCGSGPADAAERARYRAELRREIDLLDRLGAEGAVRWFARDPAYRRMAGKRPAAWATYCENLRGQALLGAKRTLSTLHWNRQPLAARAAELARLRVPTLLVYGDEDHRLVRPANDFLQRTLPCVSALVLEVTGHLVTLEEPARFNTALERHLAGAGR